MTLTPKQERRRKNERAFRKERIAHAKISGRQPERDSRYLDFIRQFECIVCTLGLITALRGSCSQAAHVGERGLRQKCSDRQTLPMCMEHHLTGEDAHHVLGKLFFEHHGLDRDQLVSDFNDLFDAATKVVGAHA